MSGLQILGIVCILYCAATLYIAFARPPKLWNIAKIQAFVRSLGEKGTVIFFSIWGGIVGGLGVWLIATQ